MKVSVKRKQSIIGELEIAIKELELFLNNPEEIIDDGDYILVFLRDCKEFIKI